MPPPEEVLRKAKWLFKVAKLRGLDGRESGGRVCVSMLERGLGPKAREWAIAGYDWRLQDEKAHTSEIGAMAWTSADGHGQLKENMILKNSPSK